MKLIPLSPNGTKHKGKYFAKVDDEDFDRLNKYTWHVHFGRNGVRYASRRNDSNTGNIRMHIEIMQSRITQSLPIVDHIDNDGLNNQRCNLRVCNQSQNICNRKTQRKSTSGYTGVVPVGRVWVARITVNGVKLYIGKYETKKLAAKAYNDAAKKYHGEFARLNIIND